MTVCALKFCHNSSEKQKKCDNITFHRIPIDPVIGEKWIKIIRLNRREVYWKPSKNTRICSKHFNEEDKIFTQGGSCRLHHNAVPVKELHISCIDTDLDQLENKLKFHEISMANGLSCTPNGNIKSSSDDKDSPREALLRKKLNKSSLVILEQKKIIKTLKQKTRRLQKRNKLYKRFIIKQQKKKSRSNESKLGSEFSDNENALRNEVEHKCETY